MFNNFSLNLGISTLSTCLTLSNVSKACELVEQSLVFGIVEELFGNG